MPHGRHRIREELGAISAEMISVVVVVGMLVAGLVAAGIPRAVGDEAEVATCELFTSEGTCEPRTRDEDRPQTDQPQQGPDRDIAGRFDPPERDIDDAQSGERRQSGDDSTGNADIDAVYEVAHAFSDYLHDRFGRDSLDGNGGSMVGTVNDPDTANALWSRGEEQTYYRDGWAVESIILHEFAHGLVFYMVGGIDTSNVEGHALNEALADIFAMNVTGHTVIGDDLPDGLPGRTDGPVRVPEDPQQLGHPDHVSGYDESRGGHRNSTILSHAYYLMTESVGWDAAEQSLYRALDQHLDGDAGFEDLRTAMLTAAEELYGGDSAEWNGIHDAFADVGLDGTWTP